MAYENPYLADFAPIFFSVLKEKELNPAKVELIIFDEETEERHPFERAGVLEVLEQLCESMNALTIYTNRPDFFREFIERVYEENGLVTVLLSKKEQKRAGSQCSESMTGIVLDFEWNGACHHVGGRVKCGYIPIHKKPWEISENLDIMVPFGYNIVTVKGKYTNDRKFVRDRFDEGFYRDE